MSEEKNVHHYPGEKTDVTWNGRLCIHIQECGRAQGDLFTDGRDPWCQPDLVQLGSVVDVVERCPTGALSYQHKDGGEPESAPAENVVTVSSNGPLYVQGDLAIDGAEEDMPGVKFRAALCRCGHSKNKPFCDHAHEEAGFQDYGAVGADGPGYETAGGPLVVKGVENGPLMIEGNFSIVSGSGRVAYRGTKAWICRCGASKNKPFCDGSHKDAGFVAD